MASSGIRLTGKNLYKFGKNILFLRKLSHTINNNLNEKPTSTHKKLHTEDLKLTLAALSLEMEERKGPLEAPQSPQMSHWHRPMRYLQFCIV